MATLRTSLALALTIWMTVSCGSGGGGGTDDDGNSGRVAEMVEDLNSTETVMQLRNVGDGLRARREQIPDLFPEVAKLISAGSAAVSEILPKFTGQPDADDDEVFFVYAYVLEQIGDRSVVPQLAEFLDDNMTGAVLTTLYAVTHAIRTLEGLPTNPTTSYLISEMEETIDQFAGSSNRLRPRGSANRSNARFKCGREFRLLTSECEPLLVEGKEVRVHGWVYPPTQDQGFCSLQDEENIVSECYDFKYGLPQLGGERFNFPDTQSGIVFPGKPTRLFHCAGFAFRHFVYGRKWLPSVDEMFSALVEQAEILTEVPALNTQFDDIVFFSISNRVAHVAVVEDVELIYSTNGATVIGVDITVINADGNSGMFRANINSDWFYSHKNYDSSVRYYRWKNGLPKFEPVTELSPKNSCYGTDDDGDGWPEGDGCESAENCINPLMGGLYPALSPIEIEKTANVTELTEPGGEVTYWLTVANTSSASSVRIDHDGIEDPFLEGLGIGINDFCPVVLPLTLGPGEWFGCEAAAVPVQGNASDSIQNTAMLTGKNIDDNCRTGRVEDSVELNITDVASSMKTTITVVPSGIDAPGGNVVFTVTVENTSTADSIAIDTVNAPDLGGDISGHCEVALPVTLEPDEYFTCTVGDFPVSGNAGEVISVSATASGVDDDANPVSDDGSAEVEITGQGLEVNLLEYRAFGSDTSFFKGDQGYNAEDSPIQFGGSDAEHPILTWIPAEPARAIIIETEAGRETYHVSWDIQPPVRVGDCVGGCADCGPPFPCDTMYPYCYCGEGTYMPWCIGNVRIILENGEDAFVRACLTNPD